MAKYDSQLGDLKNQLAPASNILIFLPAKVTVDKLAGALALMLSLQLAGKRAAVLTQDTLRVSHSNLYGVGEVLNELPKGGDLTLTLEGVVDSTGKVPALQQLDWYPEGADLNLIFHVIPGQRFEPSNIIKKYQGGKFDLIFVVGASHPNQLGQIYQTNIQNFNNVPLVNIDNSQNNSNFGTINIVDGSCSSVSEMVAQILPSLGLNLDGDIASNILTGIYDGTRQLTQGVSAETFISLGQAMQAGGRIPGSSERIQPQPAQTEATQAVQPVAPPVRSESAPPPAEPPKVEGFDLSKVLQMPNDPVITQDTPSPEEVPTGEFAVTQSPEGSTPAPDWLTPKIFKGGG